MKNDGVKKQKKVAEKGYVLINDSNTVTQEKGLVHRMLSLLLFGE